MLTVAVLSVRGVAASLSDAAATGARYREARIEAAFAGLPMDALASALDERLAATTPVRVGDSFRRSGYVLQRFTEGLYPRLVTARAAHSLEIAPKEATAPLVRLPDGATIVLVGPPDPGARGTSRIAVGPPSLLGALLRVLALLGLGRVLWIVFRAMRTPAPSVLESLLAGVALLAIVVHGAVLLDLTVPWRGLLGVGLLALFLQRRARPLPALARPDGPLAFGLQTLVACALAAFAARTLCVPVSGWDGRSIWLYHARLVGLADKPGTAMATSGIQPTYPLLLPAHLSFFGLGDGYNERAAAASLAVLFLALVGLCWAESRKALEPAPAALFVLAASLVTTEWSVEAYADGFLALSLAVQFLSSRRPEATALPVVAAAAASLLKREGLPLALIVQLVSRGRAGLGSCLLALTPAALHMAWAAHHRLRHDFNTLHVVSSLADLNERLYWILRSGTRKVLLSDALGLAFVAALFALAALATRRLSRGSLAGMSMAASCALLASCMLAFLLSPAPLAWHLDTAFGRLLLHPALLAVLAAVAAGWPARPAADAAPPR